jgi:hypothetical protein
MKDTTSVYEQDTRKHAENWQTIQDREKSMRKCSGGVRLP